MAGKSVLILSGGLDSAVLLWQLKPYVQCLTFDYGQRHAEKELKAASTLCREAGVEHKIIDLSALSSLLAMGSVSGRDPIPEGNYAAETMKSTIVPNRNMIMLSVATAYAIVEKATALYYAAHSGDHAIYPDCRPSFVRAVRDAIEQGNWDAPHLHAPFLHTTKADIVKAGIELGVPFHLTWSCYNGRTAACGKCGTCVERLEAFHLATSTDPLAYEDRVWWRTQVAGA